MIMNDKLPETPRPFWLVFTIRFELPAMNGEPAANWNFAAASWYGRFATANEPRPHWNCGCVRWKRPWPKQTPGCDTAG